MTVSTASTVLLALNVIPKSKQNLRWNYVSKEMLVLQRFYTTFLESIHLLGPPYYGAGNDSFYSIGHHNFNFRLGFRRKFVDFLRCVKKKSNFRYRKYKSTFLYFKSLFINIRMANSNLFLLFFSHL